MNYTLPSILVVLEYSSEPFLCTMHVVHVVGSLAYIPKLQQIHRSQTQQSDFKRWHMKILTN